MNQVELKVPDIGDFKDVDIIEVFIKEGDTVKKEQSLITLETDKATMEVPSEFDGIIKSVKVKVGDKISEGGIIALIEISNSAPVTTPDPVVAEKGEVKSEVSTTKREENQIYASPSVRAFAREVQADLSKISGTGLKGRITIDDVKAYIKGILSGTAVSQVVGRSGYHYLEVLDDPKVDYSKFGSFSVKEQTKIQTISSANLSRNWAVIPHVTYNDECDITDLEEFRKTISKEWEKSGLKLSPLAFIIKAVTVALKEFPTFNSSLDGNSLILKEYYNIGFAADTKNGLVVPVIKGADKMGLRQIAEELTRLSSIAREGKLKPTDMQGATFTISSLGGIGLTSFTPIVNSPEVAILGVCKSSTKPKWNGSEFIPALICPISLSADHRVIDGALAARFMKFLCSQLSDLKRLIL